MKTKIKKSFQSNRQWTAVVFLGCVVLTASFEAFGAEKKTDEKTYSLPVDLGDKKIVLYQPEVDTVQGNALTARSALSVNLPDKPPVFGAARFTAAMENKKGSVVLSKIVVADVTAPSDGADPVQLKDALNRSLNDVTWRIPAERFAARFAAGQDGKPEDFNSAPPKIYYEERPAVLVLVDGEPILKPASDTSLQTVVNSAYFIVYDTTDRSYFLKGGKWWYRATSLKGEWIVTATPRDAVRRLADSAFKNGDAEPDKAIAAMKAPPKIILSFEPSELVVVNGAPDYVSIDGTSLLYIDNTESNVIVDVNSQEFYILIAGRWYASPSIKGPWRFVPPNRLPADFSKIPDGSNASDVLVSVPGTAPADDAALAAAVPEVAAVDRNAVTTTASYDGTPKFQLIAGTQVYYALNSSIVVLKINGLYYAVDKGIWFTAASPAGPWVVATVVPDEVQDIPPSAPVYQVRYVYVYDYTPEVVYVGYTPGYYCSYVYDGVVFYGTGWYYRPWWGTVYYPHPVTFGFGVHYNPYTGFWGYPVGVSFGWIGFSWFVSPFGFWGPAGYVYGYRHGYHHAAAHGYYHGYRHGYREGYAAGRHAGYHAAQGGRPVPYHNAYAKRGNAVRPTNVSRPKLVSAAQKISRPSAYSNRMNTVGRTADRRNHDSLWKNTERPDRNVSGNMFKNKTRPASDPSKSKYETLPTNARSRNRSFDTNNAAPAVRNTQRPAQKSGQSTGNMFRKAPHPSTSQAVTRSAQSGNTKAAPAVPQPDKRKYDTVRESQKPSPNYKSAERYSAPFKNQRSYERPVSRPQQAPSRPMPQRSMPSHAPSGGGHKRR